ncbi:apoptosis-inducing factor 2 [Fusarium beomiforme]|uniref:Apoptosis-inducing factor 2 n=1 Tax=Fusarium beomiforme TaxID=44412 RepID=A0A9P5AM73_9HYPO|nr:apoptosis-inducing factor 2 [Fusarium beomiforme]
MTKAVVILGAGWAGLPLAHKLLKHTLPKVPGLKVILVSPNSHFFWNVAATRGIIPDAIPDEQLFLPIKPGFDQYPSESFEFVLGKADGIDAESNTVRIISNENDRRDIVYHELVIATGSRLASELPLKPVGTHQETISAWKQLQTQVKHSNSIVIAGAGATGTEVAGELAARYGSSKEITLVISGDQPLEGALDSVRTSITRDLKTLRVKLVYNARVTEAKKNENGEGTEVHLSSGSTLTADLYLPLHGLKLNTSFVPPSFLNSSGEIKLDEKMRVAETNNIWAIGDVGNIDPKQLTITDNQIIHLAAALDAALTGKVDKIQPYQPATKKMIFVSLGKKHATGQIGNWKLFSFMVSYVKGRKLFVDTAEGYVGGKHLRHAAM